MSIRIETYEPFEKSISEDYQRLLKGTPAEKSLEPGLRTQRLILEFIKTRLNGKKFQDQKDLQGMLDSWPDFAETKIGKKDHLYEFQDYKRLWIEGGDIFAAMNSLMILLTGDIEQALLKVATITY